MDEQTTPPADAQNLAARSASALRELEERARSALAASREQVSRLETEITGQLDAVFAALADESAAESRNAADVNQARSEVERLTQELANSRAAWLAERAELEKSRDELSQQVAKLEADERASRDEWARQLADFEQKLREQQSAWNEQRSEAEKTRTALERDRDALQQKFELALQDVQRFRGRVAELEQELARRPEATVADSAELVALRAERAALSERVEQLERQPAAPIDANTEQQLADLQRRFELAVEDVRELKTKNTKLESQLAANGKQASRPATASGMDWESQKQRLLASLEDEGEVQEDTVRQEERVRIEATIEMTDAVVAEKDREIAELKSQLAQGASAGTEAAEEARNQKISEIVDADEVIAEHRKRIALLERDMEDKLRTAELELSLERAKIARQKVELEEMQADLESQRQALGPNGAVLAPGAPRHRWLSKLGLSGEE
jgi:hypothetical protein